jgi:hypothetical protein
MEAGAAAGDAARCRCDGAPIGDDTDASDEAD